MQEKILDVPKIQKVLNRKHAAFMEKFSDAVIKVSADQELVVARMLAKISRILACLVQAGVIDQFLPCDDSPYKGFHLVKDGWDKSVYIWVDGRDILIKDSSLSVRFGYHLSTIKIHPKVDVDTFNWEEFSAGLLEYVHQTIYQSSAAFNTQVFGINNEE